MSKCINCDCLTAELFSTYSTVYYVVVATGCGASGSYIVFNYDRAIGMSDDYQCGISNGNMVGVGYNTDVCIDSGLCVYHSVLESYRYIVGHLSNNLCEIVDVAIQLIKRKSGLSQNICGDLCKQILTICIDQTDQLCGGCAILVEVVVCKICIHPCGKIHIYNSCEIAYADFSYVSGNAAGNYSDVGLNIAAGYVYNNVCSFIATELTTGYFDGSFCGIDYKNRCICAKACDLVAILSHVGYYYCVDTCVNRSLSAVVGYAVGLYANVTDIYCVNDLAVDGHEKFLSGVIEGCSEVVACIAILINDLNGIQIGNDYDVTYTISGLIVGIGGYCALEIYTNAGGIVTTNGDLKVVHIDLFTKKVF